MRATLNINTDAVFSFSRKLEKMHKSAFPSAVRGALNKAAFDTKQTTMPASAKSEFVHRAPNFFKANSRVEMAKGWDVNQMKSMVGFTSQGLKGSNNYAVKDLEQQEKGGKIKGRSFIPLDPARIGKKNAKAVRPGNRLSDLKKVVNANSIAGRSPQQKWANAVSKAGVGGVVIGSFQKNGMQTVWRIDSVSSRLKNRKMQIKKTALYSYQENRSVQVKGTGFMRAASLKSAGRIEWFFIAEAKRQFQKFK